MGNLLFFQHKVGDGVHYVNNNAHQFPDGSEQQGDTSEGCILLNIETILNRNDIDTTLENLWNQVYPKDWMSFNDMAYILSVAIEYTDDFDPTSPDNILDAIDDLRKMECPELANAVLRCFQAQGFAV